jgi:hypothetical protein
MQLRWRMTFIMVVSKLNIYDLKILINLIIFWSILIFFVIDGMHIFQDLKEIVDGTGVINRAAHVLV